MDYVYYWCIVGIISIMLEIFIPSFFMIWFGLAGFIIGLTVVVFPDISLTTQICLWSITSIALLILYFNFPKKRKKNNMLLNSPKEILLDMEGIIIKSTNERKGIVLLPLSVLGSKEWVFFSTEKVSLNDRVVICDIHGNTLVVKKRGK